MDKRIVLAIGLSLLVLISWSVLVSKTQHIENKEVAVQPIPVAALTQAQIPTTPQQEASAPTLFKLSQAKWELIFEENQAAISEVIFKDYQSSKFSLKNGFLLTGPNMKFQKADNASANGLATFVYSDKDQRITKRFYATNSNYGIGLEIEVQNLSAASININLPLLLGTLNFAGDQNEARFQDVTLDSNGKAVHMNARKDISYNEVKFLGMRNRYFCAIIQPVTDTNCTAWTKKITPQESEVGLMLPDFKLGPGEKMIQKFRIYLGPQELALISKMNPEWTIVVHYGVFNLIANVLVQLLESINHVVKNWGWSIIVLSLLIYIVLFPLTLKQMRSMKEMQALQPRTEELRKIYKDNPQKLNKEIMELYREHKINPLGGCLPLVLQMPIFLALYQALIRSVALKGAHFLWIKDLSEPDKLFNLAVAGNKIDINILPILMAIGMLIQQKTSMTSAGGVSNEQQKLMTIIMPVMFGFIFYRMPSGLVLYWFINSTLMLLYQLRVNRKI